jgi:mannose-6-phosphate isomerase
VDTLACVDLLESRVQAYAWGSLTAIPELQGRPPDGRPQAELWLGAHPSAPSVVERDGVAVPLDELIAADPDRELGAAVRAAYGPRLPFLLKVLAAGQPLSLQAHPDQELARRGHAAEEARGLAPDASQRCYRDPHHKPELLLALTPFDAVCGFRPVPQTLELLDELAIEALAEELAILRCSPDAEGLRTVVARLLSWPEAERAGLVEQVGKACAAATGRYELERSTACELAELYPDDIGVVCALLLNRVHLEPGEAVYLPPGALHAYLHGTGIEAMAASDNTIRGGLTPKHVDSDELLRVVDFAPAPPNLIAPQVDGMEAVYPVPVPDFLVSRLELDGGTVALATGAPQVLLPLGGPAELVQGDQLLSAAAGQGVFVPAGGPPVELRGTTVIRCTSRTD